MFTWKRHRGEILHRKTPAPRCAKILKAHMHTALALFCVSAFMTGCCSQRYGGRPAVSGEPEWVAGQLAWTEEALRKYPPSWPASENRQQALMSLDGVLHMIDAPNYLSLRSFYVRRMEEAIREMETTQVTEGARIWRLYNMGFVIRTPSVTMGFDLRLDWDYEDSGAFAGTRNDWRDRLARQVDVLFISHAHVDHVDQALVGRMLELQRPVVAHTGILKERQHAWLVRPPETALTNNPQVDQVHVLQSLRLPSGGTLQYVPYPGYQGELPDTVYLVRTAEGLTAMHTGDLSGTLDWGWLDHVHKHHKVDFLLVNCWVNDFTRVLDGIKPGQVLTGHEAELRHELIKRETFFSSYKLARKSGDTRLYVLCWGESMSALVH